MKSVIGTKRKTINNKRIDNEQSIGNDHFFRWSTLAAKLVSTSLNPIYILQMNSHSMVYIHFEER